MIFESAVIVKGFLVVVNRVASWFGAGYFFKKGIQRKEWRYFWAGVALSVVMLLALYVVIKIFR